jgi:hypothetical protein
MHDLTRLLALSLLTAACTAAPTWIEDGESAAAVSMPAADQARVLDLVNYPGTERATLDIAAKLDVRAATAIIARRNGADGLAPTADDVPFTTIASLDAVPYVGDAALRALAAYAAAHPAPAGEVVETVAFRGWEVEAIVWGVNRASLHELDVDVALDVRAAQNLIAKAPYAKLGAIAAIPQVGPAALTALRAHARAWWTQMHAAPHACDLEFDVIADPDADALIELVDLSTSYDHLTAEIATVQIDPCVLTDATQRARLVPALRDLPRDVVHWQIGPTYQPMVFDLEPGGAAYLADIPEITEAIQQRVDSGWKPADPTQQALYDRLPQIVDALTSGPRTNPAGFLQVRMKTDAEECSEFATALINTSNGRISIVHFFPKC